MKTLTRHTKKEAKKSTSSHSSKVARKSVTRVTKELPLELQKKYYSEKTLAEVLAVGSGYIKAHLQFDKKTTSQKVALVRLAVDMFNEAKKNKLTLDRAKLRNALYHFTEYKRETDNKGFMMSIKRVIDATFYLLENDKSSITDEGQVLNSKGKVVPVKDLDKKSSTKGSRDRGTSKKNEVATLSKAKEYADFLINNPRLLLELGFDTLAKLEAQVTSSIEKLDAEAEEAPVMKGSATMPKSIDFTNKSARA